MARIRERAADRGGSVPAILVTAYADPDTRGAALAAGFAVVARKPIDPHELVKLVALLASP